MAMQESVVHPRVRILHAVPGAPPIDVYIGESQLVASLAYGRLSDYVSLLPGRHRLRVWPGGGHDPGDALVDDTLERLRSGLDYTIVALGEVPDVRALKFEDSTQPPVQGREGVPAAEVAKVRIVHASPDAPALDVGVPGNPGLFLQVAFGEATDWRQLEHGTYDIELRRAGHDASVARLPRYDIAGGNRYTLVALGRLDRPPALTIKSVVDAFEVHPA